MTVVLVWTTTHEKPGGNATPGCHQAFSQSPGQARSMINHLTCHSTYRFKHLDKCECVIVGDLSNLLAPHRPGLILSLRPALLARPVKLINPAAVTQPIADEITVTCRGTSAIGAGPRLSKGSATIANAGSEPADDSIRTAPGCSLHRSKRGNSDGLPCGHPISLMSAH